MSDVSFMRAPGRRPHSMWGIPWRYIAITRKVACERQGMVKGIVVQVDYKMVAVQFRTNVYLTDGWMVPDHILWYPLNSQHIRFPLAKEPASTPCQREPRSIYQKRNHDHT